MRLPSAVASLGFDAEKNGLIASRRCFLPRSHVKAEQLDWPVGGSDLLIGGSDSDILTY